ncbi:MAG: DUF4163 domain-containing protein [bacterium]
MDLKKIILNLSLIIVTISIFLLVLIDKPTDNGENGNLSTILASEYTPSDADTFAEYLFDDNDILGLLSKSPSVGYKTGFPRLSTLTWEDRVFFEKKPRISIDIHYPRFIGGTFVEKLNEHIDTKIKGFVDEDKIKLAEYVKNDPESFGSTLDLVIKYRMIGVQNGVVSLELGVTDFTGGGNGNHDTPYVINWDLKSDRLLTDRQLFCSKDYVSIIAPIARKQILERIPKDFSPELFDDVGTYNIVIEQIKIGTEPLSDNFDNLLPYNGGLIVVFAPYQVHSGASGIVRTYIPENKLPNIICLP